MPSDRRRHRAPWVADENQGTRTRPTVAAVASLNWPSRYDAKFERLAKSLNTNIHAASSYVYTLNLPTRLPEDPLLSWNNNLAPLLSKISRCPKQFYFEIKAVLDGFQVAAPWLLSQSGEHQVMLLRHLDWIRWRGEGLIELGLQVSMGKQIHAQQRHQIRRHAGYQRAAKTEKVNGYFSAEFANERPLLRP